LSSSEDCAPVSPFPFPHLSDIFSLWPSHKMSRLTADGPVTGVQDKRFLVGDGIVGVIDNVRSPVRQHMSIPPIIIDVGEPPIALTLSAQNPVPATLFGRVTGHVLSEQFGNGATRPRHNERVAVSLPFSIVAAAPSLGPQGFSAVRNAANFPRRPQELVMVGASFLGPDIVGATADSADHGMMISEKVL